MIKATRGMLFGFGIGMAVLASSAMAAGIFDGRYTGPQKTTQNNNSGYCSGLDKDIGVAVINNTITWPWGRGDPLVATIGADGSFFAEVKGMVSRGASAVYQMKGRIAGGAMEADVGGTACAVHWSLRKTG